MRNYFVSRDRWHWRYRESTLYGWQYFPDSAKDQDSMKKFFAGDPVALSIVNTNNQPVNVFEVDKLNDDYSIEVTQNAKDKFKIGRTAFVKDSDAASYYHDRAANEVNERAIEINDDFKKLEFYQKQSGQQINDSFNSYVKSSMSEDKVTAYLKNFSSKTYNTEAEVYFLNEIRHPSYH